MVRPQCDPVRNFDDFDFEFSLPIHYVDIRTPSQYSARTVLEETALEIDGDLYESDAIKDLPTEDVQRIINDLQGTDELESAASELPSNHPNEYGATPYLSRHLSTKLAEELVELADEVDATPRLALLVAYAESKNSELGKSSGELKYYIQSRDQLAGLLNDRDEVTDRIEREFVSFLLLSMALVESLSYEILFKELYREEHRHETNRERVYNLPHGRCLELLTKNEIVDEDFKNKIGDERDVRNNIAHDLTARTELQTRSSGGFVVEWNLSTRSSQVC